MKMDSDSAIPSLDALVIMKEMTPAIKVYRKQPLNG
jgi:hypothetical protein